MPAERARAGDARVGVGWEDARAVEGARKRARTGSGSARTGRKGAWAAPARGGRETAAALRGDEGAEGEVGQAGAAVQK